MSSLLEEAYEVQPGPAGPPPPPIASFQLRRAIGGADTELLIQTFDDRILVLVTQTGKIGCLQTQASLPAVAQLPHPPRPTSPSTIPKDTPRISLPPPPDALATTPLIGTPPDQTLYALYTSQIATLIWWTLQETGSARRPVVAGLALTKSARMTSTDGEDDEDYDGRVSDMERERFLGVMEMVIAWPGPGE